MAEVVPPLVSHYIEFCRYRADSKKNGTLDLSEAKWFYPTTLLPLVNFASDNPNIKPKLPQKLEVRRYFSLITGQPTHNKTDSFIPIIKAARLGDSYFDQIYTLICQDDSKESAQDIKYIIGELVANIDEHSKCNASFFMAQNYKKREFLEAAFFDNGITIPGSFREAGLYKKGMNDVDCIKEALTGTSTSPEYGRGHGLPSTTKILKAINSDIFIVSGNGAIYLNGTDKYLKEDIAYTTDEFAQLGGTLISFQIHLPIKHIDIYRPGYL
ncbi:MAG: hypothetical protein QXL94_04695 [Candidatus Parvarchaeum sp.]